MVHENINLELVERKPTGISRNGNNEMTNGKSDLIC